MKSFTSTHRDGSAWILGLLLATLVLVVVLAWQAFDAARSHHEVAEAVLRDYARLAADEFVRRSLSEVGYSGYFRVMGALGQHADATVFPPLESPQGDTAPPTWDELLAAEPRLERARGLTRYFFVLDSTSGRLETSGGPAPGDELAARMAGELPVPQAEDDERQMGVHRLELGNEVHSFIYTAVGEPPRLVGFEADRAGLTEWFTTAFERGPLLPPSLAKGDGELDDSLVLTVLDESYREIFQAGDRDHLRPDPYAKVLSAYMPYGDGYEGIFEGLTVSVSLYPETASKLVIGGLPRSRLPTLLGLLMLTVGLLLAAIRQLRRARALAQLRSNFVSQVSHELRTPLTQIRMFAETLLLGRVRSEKEGRRSLEIIDQEARRLGHLVENILQFSRSERGTVKLAPAPCELVPVVRDLVRHFAPLVSGREVTFAIHPADDVRAVVDEDALRQILLNLLDNAVKYGPPKQQVRIGLEEDGTTARLFVDDEGPGVPQRERQRIWQSYQRLERDRRSAIAGTGIGLAVVHELVDLQGGTIRVEEGERAGARFIVELPLAGHENVAGKAEEVPA